MIHNEIELAKSFGFFHKQDILRRIDVFIKGEKHIWPVNETWVCAEIVSASYWNHRYYVELKTALATEQ